MEWKGFNKSHRKLMTHVTYASLCSVAAMAGKRWRERKPGVPCHRGRSERGEPVKELVTFVGLKLKGQAQGPTKLSQEGEQMQSHIYMWSIRSAVCCVDALAM